MCGAGFEASVTERFAHVQTVCTRPLTVSRPGNKARNNAAAVTSRHEFVMLCMPLCSRNNSLMLPWCDMIHAYVEPPGWPPLAGTVNIIVSPTVTGGGCGMYSV